MMKVIALILFTIFAGKFFLTETSSNSSSYQPKTNDGKYASYTECINDPTTQFAVGVYKTKYPNVSDSQIRHTICKDY